MQQQQEAVSTWLNFLVHAANLLSHHTESQIAAKAASQGADAGNTGAGGNGGQGGQGGFGNGDGCDN